MEIHLQQKNCKNCGGTKIVVNYNVGDVTCSECGEVLYDHLIDEGDENIEYTEDHEKGNHKKRTSGMENSVVDFTNTFFVSKSDEISRALERVQKNMTNKKDIQTMCGMSYGKELCDRMNLCGRIQDKAEEIFLQYMKLNSNEECTEFSEKLKCKLSIELAMVTCIFIACRIEGLPRTLEEFSRQSLVSIHQLGHAQTALSHALNIEMGYLHPKSLISRFSSQLFRKSFEENHFEQHLYFLSCQTQSLCLQITSNDSIIKSTPPQQITATCLFMISMLYQVPKVTLLDVATVCMVTPRVICSQYNDLSPFLHVILPEEIRLRVGDEVLRCMPLQLIYSVNKTNTDTNNKRKAVKNINPRMITVGPSDEICKILPISTEKLSVDDEKASIDASFEKKFTTKHVNADKRPPPIVDINAYQKTMIKFIVADKDCERFNLDYVMTTFTTMMMFRSLRKSFLSSRTSYKTYLNTLHYISNKRKTVKIRVNKKNEYLNHFRNKSLIWWNKSSSGIDKEFTKEKILKSRNTTVLENSSRIKCLTNDNLIDLLIKIEN